MQKTNAVPVTILCIAPILILFTIILSILYGAKSIDAETVWNALFHFDSSDVNHNIIITSRLPRVVAALLVGAFLAISGALMQGMTRNYLASPSIMGVTDGAAFVITLSMIFLPGMSSIGMVVCSMIGSALGAGIVFGFGSLLQNGLSSVRLAIIGTVIGTFLSSVSAAMASYFQISQNVSFWFNAKLDQVDPNIIKITIPFGIIGIILALLISKSITILSLGEEVSINLGQRTKLVKAMAILSVIFLTGTAVALVGKVGFVGLIIPHITRFIIGVDYKWILPCAGVIGGVFLALCDVLSRFVNYPFETPIGVVTSLIGIPFFLYLIRTRGGERHA
ncbi:iron(III) dicitrate transport system permease FecD [Bacillus thuringiensis serovar tolworthi]|uniref:Iron(III) dicitrate transport system permease FecD n=1 Tax=Bacillus thuringiensis subsp. tolworthi TaxID=1442 RepID=A0A9W3ZWX6_BACTO|nr:MULTISPECIES: iron ABC transporter permease [Bacillus cereus group]MEB8714890.1 iron ABC transporter permease [Bacillus cereus]MRB05643.1 iron chelate uptake ABC transporter family permease subunit [Bacillus thuringiensis]MEB9434525.1 iron ABC transporter permease [Bacillus cereus]MEB9483089.1 iron ABC transporter permease [Bacillus cereus]MEB9595570.1 iron ABC transporter permease [Bacillus cereus]